MTPNRPINKCALSFLLLLLLTICACGGEPDTNTANAANSAATTSPTQATANALATRILAEADAAAANTNANFIQQLQQAKTLWDSQNIDTYTISVRYSQPGWNTQFIDITVADGVVTDHKQDCYPSRECILRDIDPAEFTVDKLLIVAETVGNLNIPDHPAEITFSQTYGYPSSISYEDGFWAVANFQPTTP